MIPFLVSVSSGSDFASAVAVAVPVSGFAAEASAALAASPEAGVDMLALVPPLIYPRNNNFCTYSKNRTF